MYCTASSVKTPCNLKQEIELRERYVLYSFISKTPREAESLHAAHRLLPLSFVSGHMTCCYSHQGPLVASLKSNNISLIYLFILPLSTFRSVSPLKDSKPVQRSSSLKNERAHRKDRNSERRRTCLPLMSPSPSKEDLLRGFKLERYVSQGWNSSW